MKLVSSALPPLLLICGLASTPAAESPQGSAAFASGTAGVGPLVDVINDLGTKTEFDSNSFLFTGNFIARGHKLSYVYHVLVANNPASGAGEVQNVSITDLTTGAYHSESLMLPFTEPVGTSTYLNFVTSKGSITGNFDDLHIIGTLAGGSFDLHLKAAAPALFNGGAGVFPLLGMTIQEYSVPWLVTKGTITLDNVPYAVQGNSWFDRQWQNMGGSLAPAKWTWIRVNLLNNESLSIWSAQDPTLGKQRGWATILHADGSQTVAAVEPKLGATDYWISDQTGYRFAGGWTVRIPQLNASLSVTPQPLRQEIVTAGIGALYEGASVVAGTYRGMPVMGTATVEQLGSQ